MCEENLLQLYRDNKTLEEKLNVFSEETLKYEENLKNKSSVVQPGMTKEVENIKKTRECYRNLETINQDKICIIK